MIVAEILECQATEVCVYVSLCACAHKCAHDHVCMKRDEKVTMSLMCQMDCSWERSR